MIAYSLITVLEILCVNTYTICKYSKRRASKAFTLFAVVIVTAAVSELLFLLVPTLYSGEDGNGLFMLCGFLYILPLKFIFDQPVKHLIIIMSTSWIYTMFVYSVSYRAGTLFTAEASQLAVVIIQTVFFTVTLSYYAKLVSKVFVYMLGKVENSMIDSLLLISLAWFFILFLQNYTYAEGNTYLLEFVMLFIIICNAMLSYRVAASLVSVNNKAKLLKQITKIDTLTQLKNREGFYEDVLRKIDHNIGFTIIFVDLDNFKFVNDNFGHATGDSYLVEFVKSVKETLKSGDGFYRLHGDEFVILVDRPDVDDLCQAIEHIKFLRNPDGVSFKGISSGYSSFPADGTNLSELLYLADLRMYQKKKSKHKL